MNCNSCNDNNLFFYRIKDYLMTIPLVDRSLEYHSIMTELNCIISTYNITKCHHSIIEDLIDIDPDNSLTIHYCEKCHKTFK